MFTEFKVAQSFTLENSFFAQYSRSELAQQKKRNKSKKRKSGSSSTEENDRPEDNIYDKNNGCHHFSSEDHRNLGADLCRVLHKVFIKNEQISE